MDIMGLKGLKEKQNWPSTFSNSEFENFALMSNFFTQSLSIAKKEGQHNYYYFRWRSRVN